MKYLLTMILTATILSIASPSFAGDILRIPESGEYRFHARVADDELPFDPANLSGTTEICAFYGSVELACFQVDAAGEVNELLTVLNEGADKRIRGRARDHSGNTSADSVDAYLIDYTVPNVPVLVGRYWDGQGDLAEDLS